MAAEDKTSRPGQIYMTIGHPATGPSPPGLGGAVDLRLPLKHAKINNARNRLPRKGRRFHINAAAGVDVGDRQLGDRLVEVGKRQDETRDTDRWPRNSNPSRSSR